MPSTTGSVSRARPRRRATIRAREGSPRRAGSVADISTPMNVPCIASLRFALRQVGAATRIACQAIARANIEAHIRPRPAASRPGLEASRLSATRPTPMCTSASSASTRPPSEAATSAPRRSVRLKRSRERLPDPLPDPVEPSCPDLAAVAPALGAVSRLGRRWAGIRGKRSAGRRPRRTPTRPARVAGRPTASACS